MTGCMYAILNALCFECLTKDVGPSNTVVGFPALNVDSISPMGYSPLGKPGLIVSQYVDALPCSTLSPASDWKHVHACCPLQAKAGHPQIKKVMFTVAVEYHSLTICTLDCSHVVQMSNTTSLHHFHYATSGHQSILHQPSTKSSLQSQPKCISCKCPWQ